MSKKRKYKKPQAPLTSQERVSRHMRGNKSRNTRPEIRLRKALWAAGLRGYRVHWPKAPGKPDICYPSRRLAVFVHGCFWHRCPYCLPALPKTNSVFWQNKFYANLARDAKHKHMYREAGWQRLVVWECQLKHGQQSIVALIRELHSGVPGSWELAA